MAEQDGPFTWLTSLQTWPTRLAIWINFPLSSLCWFAGMTQFFAPYTDWLPGITVLLIWYLSNMPVIWLALHYEFRMQGSRRGRATSREAEKR
ncbi:hypothetical protein CLAFUW4_08904 [Fulvia fulva]|uniref:Uncharacterized protein n=1 Tax=Passalora fulva TaxID=5499 RepID=A0A9Q8PGZ8_PASFU|nr:uncharacterized protein CLAFUR5_09012 [Fulvia fulva]KAK4613629.1 hypothetical protein CLAFUR4_08910 [Fulvia fulva]KAK4614454.1 hypothetical protein CLAFUR0_08902 [Fulvia fulva]UJO22250.1 hypothetical protein CLAFUR5_09012 [Fulvia fulva]WPV20180.1 hypothetical protein CLAFUW4_08904 [Fulvia fulva]WPV35389.1 hypothetical protein CLAFUW7_08905 [Fulvia fulva]